MRSRARRRLAWAGAALLLLVGAVPLEEHARRRRRLWRAVQFAPSMSRFPGGEGPREMQARVVSELEDLRAKHAKQTVAVVSHADVIKAAVAHYVGLHLDLFQRLVVAPASLTVLELSNPVPRLMCLNDTGHLPLTVQGGGKRGGKK